MSTQSAGVRVNVVPSTPESAHVIRNLYPLYHHDLSEFSGARPNAHGVYEPDPSVRTLAEQGNLPYQNAWWQKPGVLHPFLVRVEGAPAGFALVCTAPYTRSDVRFRMQEFFIVRPFRRKGIARRAAVQAFEGFRGAWEVVVLPQNGPALAFWRRVIDPYTRGHFTEATGPAEVTGATHTFRFDNAAVGAAHGPVRPGAAR